MQENKKEREIPTNQNKDEIKENELPEFEGEESELLDKQVALQTFKEQYKREDFKEAQKTLDIARLDHLPTVMYYRGLLKMQQAENDAAILYFKRIISLEKADFVTIQSYICLSLIYSQRGSYSNAIAYLEVLTNANIQSAQIYSMLAYAYMENKEYDWALETYQKALAFDPDNHNIQNSLGYLLVLLHRGDEGYPYIEKAIKKNPTSYAFLHSMGMYYMVKKEFQKAIEYFELSYEKKKHPMVLEHMEICRKKI